MFNLELLDIKGKRRYTASNLYKIEIENIVFEIFEIFEIPWNNSIISVTKCSISNYSISNERGDTQLPIYIKQIEIENIVFEIFEIPWKNSIISVTKCSISNNSISNERGDTQLPI